MNRLVRLTGIQTPSSGSMSWMRHNFKLKHSNGRNVGGTASLWWAPLAITCTKTNNHLVPFVLPPNPHQIFSPKIPREAGVRLANWFEPINADLVQWLRRNLEPLGRVSEQTLQDIPTWGRQWQGNEGVSQERPTTRVRSRGYLAHARVHSKEASNIHGLTNDTYKHARANTHTRARAQTHTHTHTHA